MSAIGTIRAYLPSLKGRLPWASVSRGAQQASGKPLIADVVSVTDAELMTALVNATPSWLALYDAAKAINTRSVLGFTYIRAAERKALAAALKGLEE